MNAMKCIKYLPIMLAYSNKSEVLSNYSEDQLPLIKLGGGGGKYGFQICVHHKKTILSVCVCVCPK